jgi:hypothetical protein
MLLLGENIRSYHMFKNTKESVSILQKYRRIYGYYLKHPCKFKRRTFISVVIHACILLLLRIRTYN